jgi:hypothetical protein
MDTQNTVELENLVTLAILTFMENLAELGFCGPGEVDMWYRNLPDEEKYLTSQKLIDIIKRDMDMSNQEELNEMGDSISTDE